MLKNMDGNLIVRTPLKEINKDRDVNPHLKKLNINMKGKRRRKFKQYCDIKTSLDSFKIGDSTNEISSGTHKKSSDTEIKKVSECTKPPFDYSELIEYSMLKVNKCFIEDLKCPEFSPFSQIMYSCFSTSSCEYKNHKIESEQISETQEKALTFLAKSWYVLKYPLTCLVNERTHLSPFVIRLLFFGILDEKDESICLRIKDIIKGHLQLHPPCNRKLRNLYYHVLVGDIDNMDASNPEIVTYNFNNILKSIENILIELSNKTQNECKEENLGENPKIIEIPENVDEFYKFFADNYMKTGNILPPSLTSFNKSIDEDKDIIDSEGFLKRLFMVFSLMVDILEENLRMWWMRSRYCLRKKLLCKRSFPIIAKVAWERTEDIGLVNDHCIRVFELFNSCTWEYKIEISRYISLLSEVVRASEHNFKMKFPFFGNQCYKFTKELTAYVKVGNVIDHETVSQVQLIYPSWLKFKVCSFILESELTSGGVDDLNSLFKIIQRNLSLRPIGTLNKHVEQIRGTLKHSDLKNNKADSSGETLIHRYCRTNNFKALRNVLRSREVDVNIADNAGWTPLHNVAKYNSIDCLKLLIKHCMGKNKGAKDLNIFAINSDNDSPLACAVKEGNEDIVNILLSNGAGVTVWNIVSSGHSAIDHARNDHLKNILISGWKKSTSLYRNLNMSPDEIDIVYYMLTSYCNVYHIGKNDKMLNPDFCKPDLHYEFDYIQFCKDESTLTNFYELIEKLCTCRSNPKNLKNLLFYLKKNVN